MVLVLRTSAHPLRPPTYSVLRTGRLWLPFADHVAIQPRSFSRVQCRPPRPGYGVSLCAATRKPRFYRHTLLGRVWQKLRKTRDVTKGSSVRAYRNTLWSVSTATYASFVNTSWTRYAGCAHYLLITLCIKELFGTRVFRYRAGFPRVESSGVVGVRIRQEKGPFLTLHDACFGDKYLSDLHLPRLNISDLLTQTIFLYTPSLA